jgi:hypothetical protein
MIVAANLFFGSCSAAVWKPLAGEIPLNYVRSTAAGPQRANLKGRTPWFKHCRYCHV